MAPSREKRKNAPISPPKSAKRTRSIPNDQAQSTSPIGAPTRAENSGGTQLKSNSYSTSGSDPTNNLSSFAENPVDLLKGRKPTIKPREDRRGLDYVPLIKVASDHGLPDLIRVLIIHPPRTPNQTEVECSLKARLLPLRDAQGTVKTSMVPGMVEDDLLLVDFVALSYAWNREKPTESIRIRHPDGDLNLLVIPNLKAALLELRSTEDRYLWADSICIDQNNIKEKNQQLLLMPRIYTEAQSVCAWLGNTTNQTADAFALMAKIRKWKDFQTVVELDTTCEEWLAFISLMKRSWFGRRWVVQEIVMARQAELRWGSERIKWNEFAQAIAFFEAMKDRVKSKFRGDGRYNNHPDMFGQVQEFNATRLVKVTADVVTRRDDGHVLQKNESLEMLISALGPFQAGRREDIVYAVLSLAKDVTLYSGDDPLFSELPKLSLRDLSNVEFDDYDRVKLLRGLKTFLTSIRVDRFPVNYEKRFDEIVDDLYRFTTLHSGSLDLICRPWCPDTRDGNEVKLPTWVRPLKDRAFDLDNEGHAQRVNADSLVNLPGKSPYRASGRLRGRWNFERDGNSPGIQILSAYGFLLDVIDVTEDTALGGSLPASWLEHKRPDFEGSETQPENSVSTQFWRTMVAGKGPNGQDPPLSYSLVCEELFDSAYDINLKEKWNLTRNDVLKQFIDRVMAVIWGRRLARISKHKRLAVVPRTAKEGDFICIIYGCSVPIVLRKVSTAQPTGGKDVWELIGECYVYGMMAGETLVARRVGDQHDPDFFENWREFKIR